MSLEPKTTVFFIDRCLGKHPIMEMLRERGVTVEIHDDHFPQNTFDQDWIPKVGQRGWLILTKDESIGRNPMERRAVALASARMFNLASKGLSGEEMAIAFRDALPAMLKFVSNNQAPFIAKVYKNGKVVAWKNATDLLKEINK